jgi:hypothetical protein
MDLTLATSSAADDADMIVNALMSTGCLVFDLFCAAGQRYAGCAVLTA